MALVLALVTVLSVANLLISTLAIPEWGVLPAKLVLVGLLLALAHRGGLGRDDIGLSRAGVRPGLRWALGIALVVAVGLAAAFVLPGAERFLEDGRVTGMSIGALTYRVLVRIPVGTALVEELAFRGVLLGAWARHGGLRAGVIGSSAVFGVWHIGPTFALLEANDLDDQRAVAVLAVALSVVATAVGGLAFCWLRLRTRGIVGPIAVHAALNSLATIASFTYQELWPPS